MGWTGFAAQRRAYPTSDASASKPGIVRCPWLPIRAP